MLINRENQNYFVNLDENMHVKRDTDNNIIKYNSNPPIFAHAVTEFDEKIKKEENT